MINSATRNGTELLAALLALALPLMVACTAVSAGEAPHTPVAIINQGRLAEAPAPQAQGTLLPAAATQQEERLIAALNRPEPGDDEVVARVDGEPVTRGAVRQGTLLVQSEQPGTGEAEARQIAFHRAAKNAVAVAEAKRRGIHVTPEEAQRAADFQRELWSKAPPEQRALLDGDLKGSGMTEEQYWQRFEESYARSMLPTRLAQQRAEEAAKASPLVQPVPFGDYLEDLLGRARIEYKDPSLQP
ncbi:MAG: SurA N-terminal domain-containing protein [Chloroflexi bacterium]|nr:SurA N-terminal domain-containing protein [Chloroflexota bacterium]